MKRFAWLAVLPWVVVSSSEPFSNGPSYRTFYRLEYYGQEVEGCSVLNERKKDCEYLNDFAEALNEAHERREEKLHKLHCWQSDKKTCCADDEAVDCQQDPILP